MGRRLLERAEILTRTEECDVAQGKQVSSLQRQEETQTQSPPEGHGRQVSVEGEAKSNLKGQIQDQVQHPRT